MTEVCLRFEDTEPERDFYDFKLKPDYYQTLEGTTANIIIELFNFAFY